MIIILDLKNTNLLKNIEDIKKPTDVKPNSFVIIDGSRTIHGSGEWLDSKYPDFTKNPPKNWALIKEFNKEKTQYRHSNLKIYYVENQI